MAGKKYEFLEHTADAKFRAYGKDLEEAFSNAALAFFALMVDVDKVKPVVGKEVNVESAKKESLLYDFLSECLFFTDTEGFVAGKVQEMSIEKKEVGFKLRAVLLGDNADNYELKTQIKAVTYNQMFIKEEEGKVTVQVVPDI